MNKLVDAYIDTLEEAPLTPFGELEARMLEMAKNQLVLLQHVHDLTQRVGKLEKRATSRLIGIN